MARTKPNEQAQIEFIKGLLRQGGKRDAILSKFVKKWQKESTRTFDRRLKVAQADVQEEQKRIQTQAEGNVAKKVEALESKIMSAVERKIYLTKIATGEIEIPYKEGKWDSEQRKFVMLPYVELSGHQARIAAIAELNKMDGSYAPAKVNMNINKIGLDAVNETYE